MATTLANNDNSHGEHRSSEERQSSKALPILRMSRDLGDKELRQRLTTNWEFIMLTSAFTAAVSLSFLVSNEPKNNNRQQLYRTFLSMNAAAFLLLMLAVIFLMQFLTTLMVIPRGSSHLALQRLAKVEPLPSLFLIIAIILLAASIPVYMAMVVGPESGHTIVVGLLAAAAILGGATFLFWNTFWVQAALLDDYEKQGINRSNNNNTQQQTAFDQSNAMADDDNSDAGVGFLSN